MTNCPMSAWPLHLLPHYMTAGLNVNGHGILGNVNASKKSVNCYFTEECCGEDSPSSCLGANGMPGIKTFVATLITSDGRSNPYGTAKIKIINNTFATVALHVANGVDVTSGYITSGEQVHLIISNFV